ncbi:MAG: DUF368 domain-containing protein [Flavobacteriaceae bacterium]|nr:DUF368 domain-containing protein [Flavobacteriaceae bacterium]
MKNYSFSKFNIFLKGMLMGIADIVPGVSGGTIAIITGIYKEFLNTLNKLDIRIFSNLKSKGLKFIWKSYNLGFLFSLILGIMTSIIILSNFILLIIKIHPIALWSLFFGFILGSIIFLLKETDKLNFKNSKFIIPSQLYLLFLGIFMAIYVQTIKPNEVDINFVYLFFCGMISITAMLLPGISGAYILVLLGAYETMLNTFKEVLKFNTDYFTNFISFVFGALISVKLFSKFLSWSYENHKNNTLYGLIGFMIGSLPSLWPWKKNLEKVDSIIENLYIPNNYFNNSEFTQGLIFFSIGFLIVLCLEFYSKKNAIKK